MTARLSDFAYTVLGIESHSIPCINTWLNFQTWRHLVELTCKSEELQYFQQPEIIPIWSRKSCGPTLRASQSVNCYAKQPLSLNHYRVSCCKINRHVVPLPRMVLLQWASPLGLLFDERIKKKGEWMRRVRGYWWDGGWAIFHVMRKPSNLSENRQYLGFGNKVHLPRWFLFLLVRIPSAPSSPFLVSLVINIGLAEISKCIAGQRIQKDIAGQHCNDTDCP